MNLKKIASHISNKNSENHVKEIQHLTHRFSKKLEENQHYIDHNDHKIVKKHSVQDVQNNHKSQNTQEQKQEQNFEKNEPAKKSHQNNSQNENNQNNKNEQINDDQKALEQKYGDVKMVPKISDFAQKQLQAAQFNPRVLQPLLVGKQEYRENNMIFNQTPTITSTIVDTAPTMVGTVKKENQFHPLKNMKIDKKFKQVIYANDPDLKDLEGIDNNIQTIHHMIPTSINIKRAEQKQPFQDFLNVQNPMQNSINVSTNTKQLNLLNSQPIEQSSHQLLQQEILSMVP